MKFLSQFRWNTTVVKALLVLAVVLVTCENSRSQTKTIETKGASNPLKCDAVLDPKNHKILLIVDMKNLDLTKEVTKIQIAVEFRDKDGHVLGTKSFLFVDPDRQDAPLLPGKTYYRRFEYDPKIFPSLASVEPLPAHALAITELKAVKPD